MFIGFLLKKQKDATQIVDKSLCDQLASSTPYTFGLRSAEPLHSKYNTNVVVVLNLNFSEFLYFFLNLSTFL